MKNIKVICGIVLLAILVGCAGKEGIFGKSAAKIDKQSAVIQVIEDKQTVVTEKKIDQISELSFGTGYALNKATNTEPAIVIAKDLNQRIETIAGLPDIQKQKAMMEMVENLLSNNIAGKIQLEQKDKDIQALQSEEALLVKSKQKEVDKLTELAKTTALQSDTKTQQLGEYKKWFGLGAIFLGVKQLLVTSIWFIVGFCIVFLILRALAASNPIAGVIFGIFESIVASIIHCLHVLVPKGVEVFVDNLHATVKPIEVPPLPPVK